MTLKGKVILVLAFLVALIGSAGTTVFGGLQLGQGALDDISADAGRLDTATLPLLFSLIDWVITYTPGVKVIVPFELDLISSYMPGRIVASPLLSAKVPW